MKKLIEEIQNWQDETFPESTSESKVKHLKKEVGELHTQVKKNPTMVVDLVFEIVDILFLLFGIMRKHGISWKDVKRGLRLKFLANKQRNWGEPDKDGVYTHKKEEEPINVYTTMKDYLTFGYNGLRVKISEDNFDKVGITYQYHLRQIQGNLDRFCKYIQSFSFNQFVAIDLSNIRESEYPLYYLDMEIVDKKHIVLARFYDKLDEKKEVFQFVMDWKGDIYGTFVSGLKLTKRNLPETSKNQKQAAEVAATRQRFYVNHYSSLLNEKL